MVGPSVAQPSGPNILIFLTDDQRASDTVIPSVMPKLRQWLMAGGREFTNFFDSTPLCCPDRSVILSGRYAHNTGVRTNTDFANLDQSLTMERLLDANGYEAAYVGKLLNDWNIEHQATLLRPSLTRRRGLHGSDLEHRRRRRSLPGLHDRLRRATRGRVPRPFRDNDQQP